jgi:hypothetical protein
MQKYNDVVTNLGPVDLSSMNPTGRMSLFFLRRYSDWCGE